MSTQLKWIEGSPEKFEVGMLVVFKGDRCATLIGDLDNSGGTDAYGESYECISRVERYAYLIRDYQLNWHFEMIKGKK